MTSLTPAFSRINHVVFVFGMVCLAISVAGRIFVSARINDGELSATLTAAPVLTISGQVTDNSIGLPGVTMTLNGSQSGVGITDSNGNYSFEVAAGGNYTVTPSATGLAFDPTNLTVNDLSTSRIGNFAVSARTFVVTNANDQGPGSLREAINRANALPGRDAIIFDIPGSGVKVISLLSPLPEVTDPAVISANTQPGYAGTPLIELDGANAGAAAAGLVITAGGSIVEGLAIGGFQSAGIVLRSGSGTGIRANYVGVDASGTVARPNNIGIQLINSSNNLIGGTVATARNVISGNLSYGVEGSGNSNFVWGNFIGTNAAGTAAITPIAEHPGNNLGFVGVSLGGSNSLIGGTSPGAGNVISGNRVGINAGNTIQGNLIGTDVTGTSRVPNYIGIFSLDGRNMVIGGVTSGARNVISGNGFAGVEVTGTVQVQGNFIGTDITGTVALGNGQGVLTGNGASIGGAIPEARNVIAANGRNVGLSMGPAVNVQNNYIGTDVTGTRALGGEGIFILTEHHSITHNVISGNAIGILAGQSFLIFGQGNHMVIQDNLIGLNAQGTGPLPNVADGINLRAGSSNNTITANKIAFNGNTGITMDGGTGNLIRGNSIFSNGGLGIELGSPYGVTPNDPTDTDIGSNNLQNFPVITSALSVGSTTTIQGSLNSTPNTTFQIDFYSNAALDPSGYGEGALFIGATPVTTDASGDATINVTLQIALGVGRAVTATATDPNGNTSEFSAGDVTSVGGNLQFSVASIRVIEDVGLLTVTVLRKGGSAGTLTIDYATVDGAATAGEDYTGTSGTLVFNAGETSKSFQIPILDDEVTELDETFTVTFRDPPSLEALGTPSSLVVTVQDRATVPIILQNSPSVVEGNVGSNAEALFTFTLSAATGRAVTTHYATADLSARGSSSCGDQGTDYETKSGTISFQPGDTSSVTIPVKICGDMSAEGYDDFRVNLSNLSNATPDPGHGIATIVDDDKLELLLEEVGPINNQAAALDALLFLRDPFRVTMPEWYTTGPDQNTRVMFFVRGLQLDPGELPSAVVVYFGANFQSIGVPAEDVRPVPNADFVQVVVRLPDNLPESVYSVTITAHTRPSNSGQIRIAP